MKKKDLIHEMTLDSATVLELVNLVTGIIIAVMAIYAQNKINFAIFKRGFSIIAVSGIIMAVIAPYRAYYTYMGLYELIPIGRAGLVIARIVLIIGLFVLGKAAISIYGEEGEKINAPRT